MTKLTDRPDLVKQAYESNTDSEAKTSLAKNKVAGLEGAFNSLNIQEQQQWQWSSGVLGTRQYTANTSFDPKQRGFDSVYSALNAHTHSNYNIMPGASEIVTFMGGRVIRWRHQDYKLRRSILDEINITNNDYEYVFPPVVPANVLAKPTGVSGATVDVVSDTQAKYMKEQYTNNKADVEVWIAYMESWTEIVGAGIPDYGDSFRHAEIAGDIESRYKEQSKLKASGQKNRSENISVAPVEIVGIDIDGQAIYGIAANRIMVKKIGNMADISEANRIAPVVNIGIQNSHGHEIDIQLTDQQARDLVSGSASSVDLVSSDLHPHSYSITWNGSKFIGLCSGSGHIHEVLIESTLTGNFPYNEAKAKVGTVDNTNQFTLVRDARTLRLNGGDLQNLIEDRQARFELNNLDRICEIIPGIDGEGAFLEEYGESGDTAILEDRDGGTLNAAYYNRRYKYQINDAGGRTTADRGFNDSNMYTAKTQNPNILHGRTYMLPMEILLLAPVNTWDPYSVPTIDRTTLLAEKTAGAGVNSSLPFTGQNEFEFYYRTPFALYTNTAASDPADTGRTAWVEDSSGNAVKTYGSGMWQHLPDNTQRLRFPIYPVAQAFSYESVQAENHKILLKDILKSIRAGTATDQSIDAAF